MTRSQKDQASRISGRSRPRVEPPTVENLVADEAKRVAPQPSRRGRLSVVDQIYRNHEVVYLTVQQMCANPRNVRVDMGDIAELATMMREHGMFTPLLVCTREAYQLRGRGAPLTNPDATHVVLDGNRRLQAAPASGLTELQAIVRDDLAGVSDIEIQLVSSLHRKDLHPLEQAVAFEEMKGLLGTQEAVAARVGCDQSTVSRCIGLLSLPEALQTEVRVGELSPFAAATLLKAKTHDLMLEAYALMKDPDVPNRTASDAVREVKEMRLQIKRSNQARADLKQKGLEEINPQAMWGIRWQDHVTDEERCRYRGCLVAAVTPDGLTEYYCTDPSSHPGWRDVIAESRASRVERSKAEDKLALAPWPGVTFAAYLFADFILAGLEPGPILRTAIGWARKIAPFDMPEGLDPADADKALAWVDGLEGENRPRFAHLVWIATGGVACRRTSQWGRCQENHMRQLTHSDEVTYVPTAWEREQLDAVAMLGEDLSCV